MKKTLLFLLAFFAFFSAKADLLTVADGTSTNEYVPIYGYYCDFTNTTCQMIYPKTDLDEMAGGTISQIKFYPTEALNTSLAGCVLQLSLLEVDSEVFESYNAITGTVAYGTYTITGGETELVFNLTNSYEYSGDKHLLVETKVTTSSGAPHTYFYGVTQASGHYSGLYRTSRTNFLPKATFTYTPGTVLDYEAKVTPATYAFGKVALGETATTNIAIHNKGANAFTPSLNGLAAPFSTTYSPAAIASGETVNAPVTFAPTTVGDFTATLTVDCGQAGTHQVALSGTGKDGIDLDVATGTSENNSLPFCGNYCDTQNTISQMIYPKTDLASMANGTISEIKFYPTAALDAAIAGCVLQISLKEVADATFSSAAAITGTEICGTYTIAGGETEVVFELSNPFEYSGENNLLIETKVITKSGYKDTKFYGVTQSTNTGYCSAYGFGLQKFLPHATFTYTHVEHPYKAEVTPDALAFGKVNPGESSTLNVTIENKGTNAFTPSLSGLATPFSTTWTPAEIASGATATVPVTFAPTTIDDFTGTLTINCGEAGTFDVALSGKGFETGSEVVVCDGSDVSSNVPVYGTYYDTQNCQVQFIYPAEMLADLSGRKITKVTFFPAESVKIYNGTLQFSVKETEQSVFEREGYSGKPDNVVADMTVVATITPNANDTELVFEFSEPLLYNGGNLAFETLATTAGQWANTSFLGVNQSSYTAFHYGTSNYNGMDRFLPKAQFESIANTPVAESVTLAEALAGEEGDVLISSDMKVVVSNSNYAIVSDGLGNWLRVLGQNLVQDSYITNMAGFISPEEVNPVMTVSSYEPSDAVVVVETSRLDLRTIHRTALTALKPNEVATFVGYYKDGQLCAFSSGSGLHIDMTTENMVGTISTGKQQAITAVVSLKQAWDAPASNNGPARVAIDDDQAFENIKIDATSASTPTGVDGIKAIDGKEIQGIYNVNGQQVSRTDKGVYIIHYTDGTVAKVRF